MLPYIYIYPKDPWCWNIYLHWDYFANYFRGQWIGKYSSTMDPLEYIAYMDPMANVIYEYRWIFRVPVSQPSPPGSAPGFQWLPGQAHRHRFFNGGRLLPRTKNAREPGNSGKTPRGMGETWVKTWIVVVWCGEKNHQLAIFWNGLSVFHRFIPAINMVTYGDLWWFMVWFMVIYGDLWLWCLDVPVFQEVY